jgi:uncharacterized protein with von Willebrand factor type A (vWA) domain
LQTTQFAIPKACFRFAPLLIQHPMEQRLKQRLKQPQRLSRLQLRNSVKSSHKIDWL